MDDTQATNSRRTLIWVAVAAIAVILVIGSLVTTQTDLFSRRKTDAAPAPAKVKSGDPNKVAPADTELLRVVEPPANTRSRLNLTRDLGDPRFAVAFQPYGYGPDAGTLVLKLGKVTSEGGNDLAPKFAQTLADKNLVVRVAPSVVPVVREGGTYSGTIEIAKDGEASVFVLTSAERSGK